MFIFSNLATSLDGKIATSGRELLHLGTPADRSRMQVLRKKADILIMGASTLRTYRRFCGIHGASPRNQIANAVLSSRLEGISPDFPFFSDARLKRFLFITHPLSERRLREFSKSCDIVRLPERTKSTASRITAILEKWGFKKLLVEGGGSLMWDFVSENLIDEYHVTLTPKIIGGRESPTLVEGAGFSPKNVLPLRLVRHQRVGDELYLTYKRR